MIAILDLYLEGRSSRLALIPQPKWVRSRHPINPGQIQLVPGRCVYGCRSCPSDRTEDSVVRSRSTSGVWNRNKVSTKLD